MFGFKVELLDEHKAYSSYDIMPGTTEWLSAEHEYNRSCQAFIDDLRAYAREDLNNLPRVFPARFFSGHKEKFTKTERTQDIYLRRTKSLFRRFYLKTGKHPIDHQKEFVMWLLVKKQLFTTNTWKGDKFALIYTAKKYHLGQLFGLLRHTNNRGGKDHKKKVYAIDQLTSAQKQKGVSVKEFRKISEEYFEHGGDYWAKVGFEFFITIMCTGLRPIELTQSSYTYIKDEFGNSRPALKVKNAKHTNGRGNGEHRTIFLDQYDRPIQNLIHNAVFRAVGCKKASGEKTSPQSYVAMASQAFSKIMKRIFPRRLRKITLYSARHQFAADAKKTGLSHAEVAALMGHASDATAFRHYARMSKGRTSSRIPKPLPSEVATVNRVFKPFRATATTNAKVNLTTKQGPCPAFPCSN